MQKLLPLLLSALSWFTIAAQNGLPPVANARGLAMGNASSTFHDIASAFGNQAGLAQLEDITFSLGSEQRFIGNEIANHALALAFPLGEKSGTIGLTANYYGLQAYNETRIGLTYARKLSDRLRLGGQIGYVGFSIPEYGNAGAFTAEVGLQAELLENLEVAAHLANPVRQEVAEGESLPSLLRLGLGYRPNERLLLSCEMEKDIDHNPDIKVGVEYFLIEQLALRFGMRTATASYSFGLGLQLDNGLTFDLAASRHPLLGYSPALTLSYALRGKSSKNKAE